MIWNARRSKSTTMAEVAPSEPAAAWPIKSAEPARATLSIIGPNLTISGSLRGASDVVIHGRVVDNLACRVVTVAETGVVGGAITAHSVRLLGRCSGEVRSESAMVGESARLGGDLTCAGDVEVVGEVTGNVRGQVVTVAENGTVYGSVRGQAVHLRGTVYGHVEALDVVVSATATIVGNITHNTMTMEKGANHKGLRPWRARGQV
jgi:cytoskeletal protein CcmA (bactofilin family)